MPLAAKRLRLRALLVLGLLACSNRTAASSLERTCEDCKEGGENAAGEHGGRPLDRGPPRDHPRDDRVAHQPARSRDDRDDDPKWSDPPWSGRNRNADREDAKTCSPQPP